MDPAGENSDLPDRASGTFFQREKIRISACFITTAHPCDPLPDLLVGKHIFPGIHDTRILHHGSDFGKIPLLHPPQDQPFRLDGSIHPGTLRIFRAEHSAGKRPEKRKLPSSGNNRLPPAIPASGDAAPWGKQRTSNMTILFSARIPSAAADERQYTPGHVQCKRGIGKCGDGRRRFRAGCAKTSPGGESQSPTVRIMRPYGGRVRRAPSLSSVPEEIPSRSAVPSTAFRSVPEHAGSGPAAERRNSAVFPLTSSASLLSML